MPSHEKAGQEKIRSRTFGNVCSEGFYIVPSLCSTVCGKCLGVSDPAWSLISCLTHLTANNVDCSQTHWVCEWVTFSTWLPLLFFLPQALNLVCVWLFMCVSVVNHCVWDVQKEIKEVFLLLYTHTLLALSSCWSSPFHLVLLRDDYLFFPQLFSVSDCLLRKHYLSLHLTECKSYPHFKQILTLMTTDLPALLCWIKYLKFFSSVLLFPLGCVLRNKSFCNVFVLTMWF